MSVSVSEQCRACLATFTTIVSSLTEGLRRPSRVNHGEINDELERFSLWIGNIGALHTPESSMSLESRLREAVEVLSHIHDLLEDLQEVTEQLLAITSGEREGEVVLSHGEKEEISEETELFEQIGASITRLFRVSRLIRRAAPTDLFAKALSRNRYRFNDDFDIAHVGEKYPKLRSNDLVWLQKRLGRAITQRRHYLSYIQDHRDRLEPLNPESDGITVSKPQSQDIEQFQAVKQTSDSLSRPSTYFTTASTIDPAQITPQVLNAQEESDPEDDARSYTTISRSVDGDLDSSTISRIPKLEDLRSGKGKEVECPFCFRMVKFKSEPVWQRHVYSDLRPYVCTFRDCDAPFFGDINEWFRHEMQNHRVSYSCIMCKKKTFLLKEKYLAHVRHHHPEILEDGDEQAILGISQRPIDKIPAADCPCCFEWVDRLRDREAAQSEANGILDHIFTVPTVFKRHLASHLEQLALFAIPIGSSTNDSVGSNIAIEENHGSVEVGSELSALNFDISNPSSLQDEGQSRSQSNKSSESEHLHFGMDVSLDPEKEEATESLNNAHTLRDNHKKPILDDASESDDSVPYPAFLKLSKEETHQKFVDLEWEQRKRIMQSIQDDQEDSEQESWATCKGNIFSSRNRYANVAPYEKNRVKLKVPDDTNDYINASPITLITTKSKRVFKYIATQGPKRETIPHFWRMIWQETSPAVIVMLTQTIEANREKCAQYFPQSLEAPDMEIAVYGDDVHRVKLLSIEEHEESKAQVREMEMTSIRKDATDSTSISHLLFPGWPDFLVPAGEDRNAMIKLIELSQEKNGYSATNPRIIHCSAGVGRTGVFIALDFLLQELDEGSLDEVEDFTDPIYATVDTLRKQRLMMVQGEIQFAFIYDIIREKWRERWIRQNPERAKHIHALHTRIKELEKTEQMEITHTGMEEPIRKKKKRGRTEEDGDEWLTIEEGFYGGIRT